MNTATAITHPTTIAEVKALNYITATTHAQAYARIGEQLNTPGPITSHKLFKEGNAIVYVFYRARNKEQKIYVIF